MSSSGIIKIIIIGLILYCGWCVARPFIDKYQITKVVENIAQYATLNAVERTEKEYVRRIIKWTERGINLNNIKIEKDPYSDTAKVTLKYKDSIEIFGYVIKEYEFVIEKRAAKVDKII